MLPPYFTKTLLEAGCDEAGRGCLAGPVVAAAVILQPISHSWHVARWGWLEKINDSKKLSDAARRELRPLIKKVTLTYSIGIASVEEIDKINILNASFLAMHRAIAKLKLKPELLLIDGNRFNKYYTSRNDSRGLLKTKKSGADKSEKAELPIGNQDLRTQPNGQHINYVLTNKEIQSFVEVSPRIVSGGNKIMRLKESEKVKQGKSETENPIALFPKGHKPAHSCLPARQVRTFSPSKGLSPIPVSIPHKCIVGGDGKFLSIACASILAKTYRDDYMNKLHKKFPQYGWTHNKGYPTRTHRHAIEKYGATVHHRKSFTLISSQIKLDFLSSE